MPHYKDGSRAHVNDYCQGKTTSGKFICGQIIYINEGSEQCNCHVLFMEKVVDGLALPFGVLPSFLVNTGNGLNIFRAGYEYCTLSELMPILVPENLLPAPVPLEETPGPGPTEVKEEVPAPEASPAQDAPAPAAEQAATAPEADQDNAGAPATDAQP